MSENQNYEEKLAVAPLGRLIFSMALPSVMAQLVNLLYSIVDRIYVGHMEVIGTDALAGVGVTSSIIVLISAFSSIVSGGGAPIAAIELGQGNRNRAHKILGNGFVLLLVFTVFTSVCAFIFMKPLLLLNGASETTMKYAVDYLSVYLSGTLFVQISTGLNTFINAQGRPGISMLSVIIGAVLNIILDPIFIFTFGMGVKGAAIATVISQFASCLWVLCFLFSQKASLRLKLENMKPDIKVIGSIFALGVSPFVMGSTESLIGFVLNGGLYRYGGDIHVSTLAVLQSAMQMISVPTTGFAQGITPILSYNFGRGNIKRVKKCFFICLAVMFSVIFTLTILMMSFPKFVATLFTDDLILIQKVSETLPIFFAGMTIFGLQRACQNTFVALGKAKVSLFIALLRKVILLVPLALILPRFFGVMGIYAAEAIADATAAICCSTIFFISFRKLLFTKYDH